MLPLLLAALVSLLAIAPAGAEEEHKTVSEGITILHAWSRATTGPEAQVFMEIANARTADVTLSGGTTAVADAVAVHGATLVEGRAGSVPLGPFTIPAGSEFDLDPDGVFLLLSGLKAPLAEGGEFELTLSFDGLAPIEIHVEVEKADATQHSHAGHSH